MTHKKNIITTGNEAAALMAYKTNEVCAIYPITPASGMSEKVEEWSANKKQNIFGSVPTTYEMQSEAGVAGAMHGALQTGSLATTFTASQGLLLMAPNMYKMAGELTPHVVHVATRSIATHALSVFGDHSDIMAVRTTGYAFLGAASVQEAMDFSLISQAASLLSRIPFVHFFDGFRTSHESAKIEMVPDMVIKSMLKSDGINAHRNRKLTPEKPVLRGTSQGSDVFFQSREAINSYYDACPDLVQQSMDHFSELTGRSYHIFEYVGDPKAEHVIIAMASATETIEETILHRNANGARVGLVKVRLFRPFSVKHLMAAMPKTCQSIAVLDRTKEPGSSGEPLYLDVVQFVMKAMQQQHFDVFPNVVGGRYGLSSKEFTPEMVGAIIENLKLKQLKQNFTVGIVDDITHLNLEPTLPIQLQDQNYQALFYETKDETSKIRFDTLIQLVGDAPDTFVQGYVECDYNKSNSTQIAHLRVASQKIKAPYLIDSANFIACDHKSFHHKSSILKKIKSKGTLLVTTKLGPNQFWKAISEEKQRIIRAKEISLFVIDESDIQTAISTSKGNIGGLQACFLAFQPYVIGVKDLSEIQWKISKIDINIASSEVGESLQADPYFANTLLGKLLSGQGEYLPVSALPVDGTFETTTSQWSPLSTVGAIPNWKEDLCIACGACSMACPSGAIRSKAFAPIHLKKAPSSFKSIAWLESDWEADLLEYTVQSHPSMCTSCNNCVDACKVGALTLVDDSKKRELATKNWKHFESIPEFDRYKLDVSKVSQQQLQEPLFKYPLAVDGCGEAPYLKLISQLFGDRMLVANATGASSIFGGALPTTPWAKNKDGRGPAWANSLFEDNAEFGLGYRLSLDQQEQQAREWLQSLIGPIDFNLVFDILNAKQDSEEEISKQWERVEVLKKELTILNSELALRLRSVADSLVKKSVWIVGGDGWAYDIGYGGLDHVLASGKNVNILVLDNEVYDNTGGQMSKATPIGASAKFATFGKQKQKKDLGLMAMNYKDVYVASIAIGADQEQTLQAMLEAESYDGPSLIIAYCHSDSHGIDMKNPSKYQKAAVDSGQWLLYRNDPRRANDDVNTLQLDSKSPSIPIEAYLQLEGRFSKLFSNPNELETQLIIKNIQKNVDERFNKYLSKTTPYYELS